MTTGITPPGYRSDVQNVNVAAGKDPSAAATTATGVRADTMTRADGTQNYVPPDIEPTPEFPKLPSPTDQSGGQNAQQNVPLPSNPNDIYKQKLDELLLYQSTKNSGLADKVKFIINHPGVSVSGKGFNEAKEIAARFQQTATNYTQKTTGDTSFKPAAPDTASADQELGDRLGELFEQVVNDNTKLSQSDKSLLLLARNHPEALPKGSLSPHLQQLLVKYEKSAQKLFSKLGIAPNGFKPPQSSNAFDLKATQQLSDAYQGAAFENGKSASPPFGRNEMNYLNFKFNHPEGPEPQLPPGRTQKEMDAAFTQAFNLAQAQYTKETGYPAAFTPTVSSEMYDASLLVRFEDAFERQLATQSPPLTESQKTLLRSALGQDTQNIPKEIQALFTMLKGNAMAEVIKAFNLPASWSPKTRNLNDPAVVKQRAETDTQRAGVESAEEMMAALQGVVDQMPNGPTQVAYGNYLLAVGEALRKFSESLYAGAAVDSITSRNLSKATTEAQKDKLKTQQHKVDEQRKKEKEAAKLNNVLGIFMAIFMGPIGMALAIQKAVTGTNFFEQLATLIMTAIDESGIPTFLKGILKYMATQFLTIVSTILGGPMMAVQTWTEQAGKAFGTMLEAFGIPRDKAQMIGSIIAMVTILILEIIMVVMTGGAASGALVGSFGSIANMVKNISKMIVDIVIQIIKAAKTMLQQLPNLMKTASKIAQRLLKQLQDSYQALNEVMKAAQKAVKAAKETPNAVNIAKAEKAIAELTDKLKEIQTITSKLSGQLKVEASLTRNADLQKAFDLVKSSSKTLKDQIKVVEGLTADVTKAANSGNKAAQSLERDIRNFIKGFSYVTMGMTAVSTGVSATREILLGQVAQIKAEIEADNIKIKALIKQIRSIINQIINGISTAATDVKSVQKQQSEKYQSFHFIA